MPLSLLIGFEYTHEKLPSTINDLSLMSDWCQSFSCNTHIITDIYFPQEQYTKIHSISDLSLAIHTILSNKEKFQFDDRVIIYYSGHGINNNILLPNNEELPFCDFRDIILYYFNPNVEIFWVIDCCNPQGLQLPYKFSLSSDTFMLNCTKKFFSNRMFVLTSADSTQKSISTSSGSTFTKSFVSYISSPTSYSLSTMISVINHVINTENVLCTNLLYPQNINLFSSYIDPPVLWPWIGGHSDFLWNSSFQFPILRSLIDNPSDCYYSYS